MKQTYEALRACPELSGPQLDRLPWCSKCRKHVGAISKHVQGSPLEVVCGVNAPAITIKCTRCTGTFGFSFKQKIATVGCKDCQREDLHAQMVEARQQMAIHHEMIAQQARATIMSSGRGVFQDRLAETQATQTCLKSLYCSCENCFEILQRLKCERLVEGETDEDRSYETRERAINEKAAELAKAYLSSASEHDSAEKVFLIYKFVNTPETMIMQAIEQMEDRG